VMSPAIVERNRTLGRTGNWYHHWTCSNGGICKQFTIDNKT
jgi:hypothetical protein